MVAALPQLLQLRGHRLLQVGVPTLALACTICTAAACHMRLGARSACLMQLQQSPPVHWTSILVQEDSKLGVSQTSSLIGYVRGRNGEDTRFRSVMVMALNLLMLKPPFPCTPSFCQDMNVAVSPCVTAWVGSWGNEGVR